VERVYPQLPKISVDYALMEPASRDPALRVCVVPMSVEWKDVGSWPSYGETLPADADGNRTNAQAVHAGSSGVLAVSDDPAHVIATVGLKDVIVVRTEGATLVVRADLAEKVKDIAGTVPEALR
jgi:mannose-1-phosphate guanylyltransferase